MKIQLTRLVVVELTAATMTTARDNARGVRKTGAQHNPCAIAHSDLRREQTTAANYPANRILPTYLLPTHLFTYLPTNYLFTCLPVYSPTYLPATYLSTSLPCRTALGLTSACARPGYCRVYNLGLIHRAALEFRRQTADR